MLNRAYANKGHMLSNATQMLINVVIDGKVVKGLITSPVVLVEILFCV